MSCLNSLNRAGFGAYGLLQYTSGPHISKFCFGKTPFQCFIDSKHLAFDKDIANQKNWGVSKIDESNIEGGGGFWTQKSARLDVTDMR
jgi:hypothetical protein